MCLKLWISPSWDLEINNMGAYLLFSGLQISFVVDFLLRSGVTQCYFHPSEHGQCCNSDLIPPMSPRLHQMCLNPPLEIISQQMCSLILSDEPAATIIKKKTKKTNANGSESETCRCFCKLPSCRCPRSQPRSPGSVLLPPPSLCHRASRTSTGWLVGITRKVGGAPQGYLPLTPLLTPGLPLFMDNPSQTAWTQPPPPPSGPKERLVI